MSAKQQVESDKSTRTLNLPDRYGEEIQQHKIHTTRACRAGKHSVLTRISKAQELMKDKDIHAELNVIWNP